MKILLYPATAYYIFQECFKKAQLIKSGKFEIDEWSLKLRDKLEEHLKLYIKNKNQFQNEQEYIACAKAFLNEKLGNDHQSYKNYLRDRFKRITVSLNENSTLKKLNFQKDKFDALLLYAEIEDYEVINDFFAGSNSPAKFYLEEVTYWGESLEQYIPLLKYAKLNPNWLLKSTNPINKPEEPAKDVEIPEDRQTLKKVEPSAISADSFSALDTLLPMETATAPVRVYVAVMKKPFLWFDLLPICDEGELLFHTNGDCEYQGSYIIKIKSGHIKSLNKFANHRDADPFWIKVTYLDNEKLKIIYFAEPIIETFKLKIASPDNLWKHFPRP